MLHRGVEENVNPHLVRTESGKIYEENRAFKAIPTMKDSIAWRRLVILRNINRRRRGDYRSPPGERRDLELEIDLWPHVSRKADEVPN